MELADGLSQRLKPIAAKLPERVPPFSRKVLLGFRIVWLAALALAIIGPIAGIYLRLTLPPSSAQLFTGSRAGLGLAPDDATIIRFPVGDATREAGISSGHRLIALNGENLPEPMPITQTAWEERADEPAYQQFEKVFFGDADMPVELTVRSPSGQVRQVRVRAGEFHFNQELQAIGLTPKLAGLSDVLHVIFYPLLVWIAVVLHLRNRGQIVPEILSLAILLMLGAEQPSSTFLSEVGVARFVNVMIFDLANIGLIAAILLFPDGRLTPRPVLIPLLSLPVLLFLMGDSYRLLAAFLLLIAFFVFVQRLKGATGATRQQLKLFFAGVAAWPAFITISMFLDLLASRSGSATSTLAIGVAAGIAYAASLPILVFVLFSALRRHRLYDAETLFSRSAMIAALTLSATIFFAVTIRALESGTQAALGRDAGPWPALVAAAAAALLFKPAQRRLRDWAERRFQKQLFELRTELPKQMEDLRETAKPTALLKVALANIVTTLRATGAAAIVDGRVVTTIGGHASDAKDWLRGSQLPEPPEIHCDRSDPFFPVRVPLRHATGGGALTGWILLGPRPDGSIYSKDERDVLLSIEESIARAVEVSRQRQQTEGAERRWRGRQEKRVRAVEEQLAQLITQFRAKSP